MQFIGYFDESANGIYAAFEAVDAGVKTLSVSGKNAADSLAQQFSFCNRLSFGKTANAEEESRALFSILREADDRGYTRVYIQLPPPEGGYLALYNRLIRAAGGRIVHIK